MNTPIKMPAEIKEQTSRTSDENCATCIVYKVDEFSIQQDLTEMPTAILDPWGKYKSIGPEWKHATLELTPES